MIKEIRMTKGEGITIKENTGSDKELKDKNDHKAVEVFILPKCDLCGKEAKYDVLIPRIGKWGNLCQICFDDEKCSLGLGKGQELIVKE